MKRKNTNNKPSDKGRASNRRPEGTKDSKVKRVNYDNARVDKVEKDIEEGKAGPGRNDPSYYMKNPTLLTSAGSLPFAPILGQNTPSGFKVPGVMTINWVPSLGPNDVAISQAFDSQYSFIVHANSRNQSYDAPDLAMTEIAGANVFSIISAAIRAYGTVKYYKEQNLYYPDALLVGMGFEPQDFRDNMAQIWFDINNFIDQTGQIWIPNTMPLYRRWIDLNTNVYLDAPGNTAQTYFFVQSAYWIYDQTMLSTGGSLGFVAIGGGSTLNWKKTNVFSPGRNQYPWATWRLVIQSMISALVNSQDRGIMYGDILKAYTADKIMAMSPIQADLMSIPVYNAEMQTQFENVITARTNPTGLVQYASTDSAPIRLAQSWPQGMSADGYFATTGTNTIKKVIGRVEHTYLNYHIAEQPAPIDNAIATRMRAGKVQVDKSHVTVSTIATKPSVGPSVYFLETCGTEVPIGINLVEISSSAVSGYKVITIPQFMGPTLAAANLNALVSLSAFDWHPAIYIVSDTESETNDTGIGFTPQYNQISAVNLDFDNYTSIDDVILNKLHTVCTYSLLDVPVL
nr:capsid protein [Rat picobirnavirus]